MTFFRKLIGKRAEKLFLTAGLLLMGWAMYQLILTAMYVHESVVVTATVKDVVQKPFESTAEALTQGNLCMGDSPSYQAIVHYTVPNGLVIDRMMTDADSEDYSIGQQIEVITPPLDPSQAHIYKWKFIWGWECMQLGLGAILLLVGFALRSPKPPVQAKDTASKKKTGTSRRKSAGPRKTSRRKKQG